MQKAAAIPFHVLRGFRPTYTPWLDEECQDLLGAHGQWHQFLETQRNGLPQGYVFAPVLFNVYSNDLPVTRDQKFIYAEDIRVAQIKIPHRTKCNFSTTVWDFYTQIFWFIYERSCYNSEIFLKIILVFSKVMAV